ncbi:CN hydrolase domain-containing protein [Favolaschia claudopus]|uniref:CN hydrolase domain-containing protein n=1 Tax=Favolaschia claudopus TaxID=2862362 RepID=A0AAV9ZL60_9AGAR
MVLDILPLVFDCPRSAVNFPGSGALKMTANRYTASKSATNTQGLTFIFLHGIAAHKEQWEPLIEELFFLQQNKPPHLRVREAWSLDRLNHGEAAVLNADELARNRRKGVPSAESAEGIAAFLNSEHMKGHRVVVVGHSAGSVAGVIATKYLDRSTSCIVAMILTAPAMVAPEIYHRYLEPTAAKLSEAVLQRPDTWASREEAHHWLKARFPWNVWDERVLKLYVEHGLTTTLPNTNVTLKCTKPQESLSFPDTLSQFIAIEQFQRICHSVPLHIVWGTKDHIFPEIVQGSVSDESQGRVATSVTKMVGCGHLMFQDRPGEVARVISRICDGISSVAESRVLTPAKL